MMKMKDLLKYPDYDSPIVVNIIDTMAKQIATDVDNSVANAIHKVGIDIDKDKLVSAIKQDKERYEEAYRRGFEGGYNKRDSDIVRCKDCEFEEVCCRRSSNDPNWYCADGQRRDED